MYSCFTPDKSQFQRDTYCEVYILLNPVIFVSHKTCFAILFPFPVEIFDRASEDERIKPGSIVSGVVDSIAPHAIVVGVNDASGVKGTIFLEHLADHHGNFMPLLLFDIIWNFHYVLLIPVILLVFSFCI